MASVLDDLLREDLSEDQRKVVIRRVYELSFSEDSARTHLERSKTPTKSKSLLEFYDLVRSALDDYESRSGVIESNKVLFTEEEPDEKAKNEAIVFSLIKRDPGSFSQGAPMEGKIRNLKPVVREEGTDPEFPDYKQVVMGYCYDNIVRFTCWARTNKTANRRAAWFENFMDEYSWWFKLQGVNQVIFFGREADIITVSNGNRWYGRPADFFVRTEKLRVLSEKTIEEIIVKVGINVL